MFFSLSFLSAKVWPSMIPSIKESPTKKIILLHLLQNQNGNNVASQDVPICWDGVINYWVEWDCGSWVWDLVRREPTLWSSAFPGQSLGIQVYGSCI